MTFSKSNPHEAAYAAQNRLGHRAAWLSEDLSNVAKNAIGTFSHLRLTTL
jgi:hypothetical protein